MTTAAAATVATTTEARPPLPTTTGSATATTTTTTTNIKEAESKQESDRRESIGKCDSRNHNQRLKRKEKQSVCPGSKNETPDQTFGKFLKML